MTVAKVRRFSHVSIRTFPEFHGLIQNKISFTLHKLPKIELPRGVMSGCVLPCD